MDLIHITAEYSNAVLVAILPYVSDFAETLQLGTPLPASTNQVRRFQPDPRKDFGGGWLTLTNGWEFWFDHGHVSGFRCPRSYHTLQDPDRIPEFFGAELMTQKQALTLARGRLSRLGYAERLLRLRDTPAVEPPPKVGTNTVPFYRFEWPRELGQPAGASVSIEIDAQYKTITQVFLGGTNLWRPSPRFGVEPELERDFLRRTRQQFPPAEKLAPRSEGRQFRTNSVGCQWGQICSF